MITVPFLLAFYAHYCLFGSPQTGPKLPPPRVLSWAFLGAIVCEILIELAAEPSGLLAFIQLVTGIVFYILIVYFEKLPTPQ